nr:RNA-directed DNA polymerase, eukaryota, reverse transcriptase zinc-binding domain protein [Tanacetum cinerariifolium]
METSSTSTTSIVDKIRNLEKLIIDRKVTLVDDESEPVKKVVYLVDHDSEDEVASVDNNMLIPWLQRGLVTCDLAMGVWDKVSSWWKLGSVNAFFIDKFFSSMGNVNVTVVLSRVWQAVVWTITYFIWKKRNARVFGYKVTSTNKIVKDIQLRSFEWIVQRSNKYKGIDCSLVMFSV